VRSQTPLPSPLKGEKPIHLETKFILGSPTSPLHRKRFVTMPSPLGEGQVNTPIITLIWVRSHPKSTDKKKYQGGYKL